MDTLSDDIFNSFSDVQSTDLSSLVDIYDSTLRSLIDKHAPLKQRLIPIRPNAPWYSSEVTEQKRIRRNLERKWRSTRSKFDRQYYVNQCGVVIHLISSLKSEHYTNVINQHSSDQKTLFKTVNKLLQKSPVRRYPASHNDTTLVDSFADYFTEKIEKIHQSLSLREDNISGPPTVDPSIHSSKTFCVFEDVTLDQIAAFASKPSAKSCCLDPIRSAVFKECSKVLLPTIGKIVNMSLSTATMVKSLKTAVVSPCLKKPDADHNQFSNFRPVSNLSLISKIIEKAVAVQLTNYIVNHHMDEMFQSAYKVFHSTETALVKVHNDILRAVDNNDSVVLLLLDLSAAFDTVDHSILLSRLALRFGVDGQVIAWIESYLKDREQFVQIENTKSSVRQLLRGVPQGSVLGPLLYVLYTSPIADIIKSYGLHYHLYADDSQIYVFFPSQSQQDLCLVKSKLEACVKHIDSWMVLNRLKLNQDKTELLLISSRYRQSLALSYLQVGEEKICPSKSVRNLGVHFDQHAMMHVYVKNVCQGSFYHLRNISKIRRYLSQDTTEILIHAYITSKLDNCNSLLYGLPTYMINKLQSIQNAAARIVTFTKKTEHITPVLCKLHWLPVRYRIIFKVLLLVYKGLNGLAPAYISELLHYRTSSRSLRSSSQRLLSIPRTSLKTYGDRAFSAAGPRLWNDLPLSLRSSNTLTVFKKDLKTYLFKFAFS